MPISSLHCLVVTRVNTFLAFTLALTRSNLLSSNSAVHESRLSWHASGGTFDRLYQRLSRTMTS